MNVSRRGEIDLSAVKYVDPAKDDRRLLPGDVLFNNTNSPALVGKTAVVRRAQDFAFSNHMTRIRLADDIDPSFVAVQLHYLWMSGQLARHINNHVNQASISAKKLASQVAVRMPPLAEQKRIVAAIEEQFSHLDAADASLRSAQGRTDLLQHATVRALFDELDCEWVPLGEMAEIRGGVTKDSKRQSDPEFVEVPYLRVANVQRGYLDLDDVTSIRVPPTKAHALALEPGDILFNEGGDRDKLGRGSVWEGQIPRCIHQNHVFRARLTTDDVDPYFVSVHGNTWGRRWFEDNGKQTTNLASINMTTLKRFPVPKPPIGTQRDLMRQLDRATEGIGRLQREIREAERRSESLRRSVLAAAFAGEIVPQDPSDEPASALLDRIRDQREAKPAPRKRMAKVP